MSRRSLAIAAVLVPLAAVALGGCGSTHHAAPASPTAAASTSPASSASSAGDYLALGDSVSFGYREPTTSPAPNYGDPTTFVGYPELVAKATGLQVANAACPGETGASLLSATGASNGCESTPGGKGPGYRTAYPLHVSYQGTQIDYATAYLKAHPDTKLVTLMIGANDGFLCQETTADHCVSEISGLFTTVQHEVGTILSTLRAQGGYQGKIILVSYYSTDYSSAFTTGLSQGLNGAILAGAKPYNVTVADGLGALQAAAASAGGKTCDAGLLTKLSSGGCGVHPSATGQAALARAVETALKG